MRRPGRYVWGGLLVCFGVYLNMAAKQRNSRLVEVRCL